MSVLFTYNIWEIIETILAIIYVLFMAVAFSALMYDSIIHPIILKIDGLIPGAPNRRRKRKVKRVKKLIATFPDAYREWYGIETSPLQLSEDELDERLERPELLWREKQKTIEAMRALYNQRMSLVNDLCSKYPFAYREIIGKPLFTEEYKSIIRGLLKGTQGPLLTPNQAIISKTKKQKFKKSTSSQCVENIYSLTEGEVSTLINTPEQKFSVIEARFDANNYKKYLEICKRYPNGVVSYKEKYPFIKKQPYSKLLRIDFEAHESEIIKYEEAYQEHHYYKTWLNNQDDFIEFLKDKVNEEYDKWGYACYSIDSTCSDLWGNSIKIQPRILHLYKSEYCKDETLDYSLFEDRIYRPSEYLYFFNVYRQSGEILSFVNNIPNLAVLYSDEDNYVHSKLEFKIKGIPVYTLSEYLTNEHLDNDKLLLLYNYASRSDVEQICKRVILSRKKAKPSIACFSLFREYSSEEMMRMIQEEEQRISIEKIRKERELEEKRLFAVSHTNKTNWTEFREYLRWNGVSYFYHFTDRANLDSIRERGGLFSWKYCEEHDINIPRAGGSEFSRSLDERHCLEDYVRLSFCDDHPMAYRLRQDGYNLVLLKIDVRVAWLQDTLFSDINATDSSHHHGGNLEDLKRVDIAATKEHYVSQESPSFKKHQAEVLVKTFIPLEYITMPYHSSNNGILGDLSLVKTQTQTERWKEKDRRNFTVEEINAVESTEIVASTYGLSVRFAMKGGGITYLPLASSSAKRVGESIDLTTAKLITLGKKGAGDIYRIEV